ncbi:hypothetical protein [Massilia forsythiae]|nr:hypothetical protein [Massilia forsythiae]
MSQFMATGNGGADAAAAHDGACARRARARAAIMRATEPRL